jgi:hypothetical protein
MPTWTVFIHFWPEFELIQPGFGDQLGSAVNPLLGKGDDGHAASSLLSAGDSISPISSISLGNGMAIIGTPRS